MKRKAESTAMRVASNPARWQRLKHLLADALEQVSVEERTTMLRRSCADDITLLREAEDLLACDTTAFEQSAELAGARLNQNEQDRIGERIGAYAIIRELGRGGMGAVYLGERADGQFQKLVAIKILKRGTDTDEVLRRFRNERQILANLDHSNITRLLDAGITGDGLPYFVMEFVEGTPITRFAQRENLDLKRRLELFLRVCSAVDLAHRNHIIHRDIKPGNILVKQNGEPKLLDFGIAKLLGGRDEGDITVAVERRLTPIYAAPEQAAGQSATVATDIYSLGALLYELLTNQQPPCASSTNNFPLEDTSTMVRSLERLPSQSVTDARMKHELEGQLDRIVERAMEKEPVNRYPSVADLGTDIEQYLNGSVASRAPGAQLEPPGATAKARRGRYIAAPIVGLILLAAAVVLLRGRIASLTNYMITHKTAPVASAATDSRIHSIAVLPFERLGRDTNGELLGLGMADAVIGRMGNLRQLLVLPTSAVLKYKGPASDPLAAGRALHVDAILTGTVQRSGDRVRVTVQLVGSGSGRTLWSEKFDQTFTDIFGIQDSISDKVARSLVRDFSKEEQKQLSKHYTSDTAAYNSYLTGLYFWNTRSKDGLEKAIDYFQRAVERDPSYALAYAVMADCYYLQLYYGYSSAPDRIRNAKAAAERALLLDDSVAEGHVAAAMVQFYQKGDQVVTESAHQDAMDSLRRALALNPNLAIAHMRYALALCAFGHLDDAVQEMKRAQELDPLSPTNNIVLGITLTFARQFRESLEYCYKAAELDPNSAPIQENLALAYALNGMYQQAIEHYQKEAEFNPEKKGDVLALIATVLASTGRKSEADLMMPEVLQLAASGKADPYNIAVLYGARGEADAAFKWFEKVLRRPSEVRTNGNDSRMIRYDPMLDPLRSDTRFAALLRQHDKASLLEGPGTATEAVRSIAVLPFEPLGQDMNGELLGLGMADAIIGRMSNLKQLTVLPTSAVWKYKGPANDPLAAGRALGVDAVLSGTVQRSGEQIRATVQLVRVATGHAVWSAKFDETFTDIFAIQDSISDQVARSLVRDLSKEQQKQLLKHYTNDTAAYDSYLMGLYLWNQRSKDGLERAIGYFHQAVERDPNFALAYALMADCYYLQMYYRYSSAPDRIPNAKAAAERAQLLDDSIAEGHVAVAMVQLYQRDDQAAMESLRRALALNPSLAIAHQRYAWALSIFGNLDEAVREMKLAQELDPLSPTNNTALGIILVFARQFPEALEYCYKAAELDPNSGPIQENLAVAYALNGMYQRAIEHYQRDGELNPEKRGDVLSFIATVLVSAGRKSESESILPEILQLAATGKADPYNIAVLYGVRGEAGRAFDWFDKALQQNSEDIRGQIRMIRYDPMLDSLRSDARFAELLRRHDKASLLDNH